MEVITKAQYERDMEALKKQVNDLLSLVKPLIAVKEDAERVVDWREACKITQLSPTGLADARRKGRIKSEIKLNAKEFGYKIKHLDLYIQRYRYNGN